MARGIPFVKGQSGNPNGRPKGSGYKVQLSKLLAKKLKEKGGTINGKEATYEDVIVYNLIKQAVEGRDWAIKIIVQFDDALRKYKHEFGGMDGSPVNIIIKQEYVGL